MWYDKLFGIDDTGPIDSFLMVVVAGGFLEIIEKDAIQNAVNSRLMLKSYRRYVDDSHARFPNEEHADRFLDILNNQNDYGYDLVSSNSWDSYEPAR